MLAKPQGGVDAISALFPNTKPVQGVTDNGDMASRPVPRLGMKNLAGAPIHYAGCPVSIGHDNRVSCNPAWGYGLPLLQRKSAQPSLP